MGQVPDGFKAHPKLDMFGNGSGLLVDGEAPSELPNGTDFWWDEHPTNNEQLLVRQRGPGWHA